MKATGIVRRIDDLGRVVIPKEIRRTMRIREGDPLEIYTDTDGEVIFKKYSPIGELGPYTQQYADVLSRTTGLPSLLCDRDRIIAAAGLPKKQVLERPITKQLEERMEAREAYMAGEDAPVLEACDGLEKHVAVMYPIIRPGYGSPHRRKPAALRRRGRSGPFRDYQPVRGAQDPHHGGL